MFITESNMSSAASEASVDIFGALWLADYVGSFFTAGGDALYYFHYIPFGIHPGCNNSQSTFGMFAVDAQHNIAQPLSQFFASQLINLEWFKPGDKAHEIYPAESDIRDDAGHVLVTAYAVKRPDGLWALLVINKDQENAHKVQVKFHNANAEAESFVGKVDMFAFGRSQYRWDPLKRVADPDGPVVKTSFQATSDTVFEFSAASITVLRGKLAAK